MPDAAAHTAPPQLLLVSADPALASAARAAANVLGGAIEIVADLDEAIPRLLNADAGFSHVLAPANLAAADIDALAGMVDEVIAAPTRLLLLGASEDRGPTEVAVPVPDAAGIEHGLRRAPASPAPPGTALTAEELRATLHAGSLRMRFQPVVDATSFQPLALEALARVHHATLGILRPQDFIETAVASGQERALTGIAAARTMLELRPLRGLGGLLFAINTPLTTLLHVYAADRAAELCAVAGIPNDRIVIEALETMVMPDLHELAGALERWRRAGFNITIDDAGPRLPHWHQLLDLPFNGVKLDGLLAADTPDAADLAARITGTARQRGLYVVAEGIETKEAALRLRAIGVNALQGFHFSRPLPARAVPVWLAGQRGGT